MLAQEARVKAILLVALALIAILAAWLAAGPIAGVGWRRVPRPAASFEEAVARVRADARRDGPDVASDCHSILLEHGRRTGRVIVCFHGITNCPAQFLALGNALHERGANVYVPRIPHHGLADRMTEDLKNLEAQELADFADAELDIARGLGDTVVVTGLSLGAVLTADLAQEREEGDLAVPIAPLMGPAMAPAYLARPLTRVALAFPNRFLWWDDKKKEKVAGPTRVYPRFATHAMAEIMRLGAFVEDRAGRSPPKARKIVMVTVGGDPAVSNAATASLVRAWRARAGERIQAYEFPESLKLGHDVIDPDQPYQQVGVVYPVLVDLLFGIPR